MKWFNNLNIGKKLALGFGMVIVILITLSTVSFRNFSEFNDVTKWNVHTYEVLAQLDAIIESLINMETGQRGYSITGEKAFLEPFNQGKASFETVLSDVKEKTKDNPKQQDLLNRIGQLEQEWMKTAELAISYRNDVNQGTRTMNEVIALEQQANGKQFMDEIRKTLDQSITMENDLLKERTQKLDRIRIATNNTLIFGTLLAIILAIFITLFITKRITTGIFTITAAAERISVGDTDLTLQSETTDEIGRLTEVFSKMVNNIREQADVMKKIADGNLDVEVHERSENDVLSKSMKHVVVILQKLIAEVGMLTKAAMDGQLNTRGDAANYNGGYRDIVNGMNKTLDAVVKPLNVAAEYVERISKGDIPSEITDTYHGDFNEIKNNLNTCIRAIKALISDVNTLAQAAVEGQLSIRAEASRHTGDFYMIVQGVNATLDAVIQPINEASTVLQQMAQGNLKVMVAGNYKGDHAAIKEALNSTILSLRGYVEEISQVLTEMAESNLNVGITREYLGDFGQIKDSLNLIISSFNDVLIEINNAADQVSTGARSVSDSSQELSQGASEQASTVEQITASMTEIAAQTKQNALNANQANVLAILAKTNAVEGNDQMKSMLNAMKEINESSGNISKIIKVIDEIAFQTNILALNAAVEAARAGQHGKGFAVVAEEVRNLAARSANAAKETTVMIEGSIKKVEDGTKIANETAEALNKIVEDIAKAATLVGDIAAASNEQATGITQVNQGIAQVSQVTQTNSATAEQSASASEELASQADLLKSMIKRFSLKNGNVSLVSYGEETSDVIRKGSMRKEQRKSVTKDKKVRIELDDQEFGKY